MDPPWGKKKPTKIHSLPQPPPHPTLPQKKTNHQKLEVINSFLFSQTERKQICLQCIQFHLLQCRNYFRRDLMNLQIHTLSCSQSCILQLTACILQLENLALCVWLLSLTFCSARGGIKPDLTKSQFSNALKSICYLLHQRQITQFAFTELQEGSQNMQPCSSTNEWMCLTILIS